MKRFFVFMLALVGLGVVMSGCATNVFRNMKVKDAYIQKNYIDKVKIDKKKVVGDRNIKFYVGKVVDKRKDKGIVIKRMAFYIRTGDTELANTELTIRNITEKALFNTGWGVVDNKSEADFTVNTVLNDFRLKPGLLNGWYITNSNVYVLNKTGQNVLEKSLYSEKKTLGKIDLGYKFYGMVGDMSVQYYSALLDYFSSSAFVNAVKKAYTELTK